MDNMPGNNNNKQSGPNRPVPPGGGPGPGGPGNRRARDIGFYALVLVILLAAVFSLTGNRTRVELPYSEMIGLFEDGQVESYVLAGNELTLYLREPYEGMSEITRTIRDTDRFYEDVGDLIDAQRADGTLEVYDDNEGFVAPWWLSFLPYLIVIVVFGVLWYVMMSRATGAAPPMMSSSARPSPTWPAATRKKRSCRRSWSSSRTRRPTRPWAPASPRACCW